MVKLATTETNKDIIEGLVADALAPFYEQVEEDSPYRKFQDETDEVTKKYNTETTEMVEWQGKKMYEWDLNKLMGEKYSDIFPKIQVPFKELYATVEEFAKDYSDYQVLDGRFGRYCNPNAKWDWFEIGGRWKGKFNYKLKPGAETLDFAGNMVRISDLDLTVIAEKQIQEIDKLWDEFVEYNYGRTPRPPKEDPFKFFGVHAAIDRCGLVTRFAKNDPLLASCFHVLPNDRAESEHCWAYPKEITKEEFAAKAYGYCNPIRTYAVIDQNGNWITPGDMGWFGMSSAESENLLDYNNNWMERHILPDVDKDIVLVVVDCHI